MAIIKCLKLGAYKEKRFTLLTVLGSDHGLVVAGINGRSMKKGSQEELKEGPALFFFFL